MTFDEILNKVAEFSNISPSDILGKRRTMKLAVARQIVAYLCRNEMKQSFPEIAKSLNNDHSTAIYSFNKIRERMKADIFFNEYVNKIAESLRNNDQKRTILTPGVLFKFEGEPKIKVKRHLTRFQKIQKSISLIKKEDLNRQKEILQKFREGFTLNDIGRDYKLTRERIRQIVGQALLHEAYTIFKENFELEADEFVKKNLKDHLGKKRERYGIATKTIKIKKTPRWSRDHDYCRKCGKKTIKHIAYGYCKWCYPKSDIFKKMQRESNLKNWARRKKHNKEYLAKYLKRPEVIARRMKILSEKAYDGNRGNALKRDGYKCRDCGITQSDSIKKYNRDLYVHRINGNSNHLNNLTTLCMSCHIKKMSEEKRRRNLI